MKFATLAALAVASTQASTCTWTEQGYTGTTCAAGAETGSATTHTDYAIGACTAGTGANALKVLSCDPTVGVVYQKWGSADCTTALEIDTFLPMY